MSVATPAATDQTVAPEPHGAGRALRAAGAWLHDHDPGYAALRRAGRTALVMPAMFALGDKVIGNPVLSTFAAFGSFAMLLLVDFSGPIRDRLLDQAALGITCALLISLATLVSRTTWLAAVAMAAVAFGILFAGAVSSVLAGATTSLILAFILPVSLAGSASAIPDRIAGWGLAAAVSLPAIALLWPAPARNPVRAAAANACRALADRLRAEVAYMSSDAAPAADAARRAAIAAADQAVATMERLFFATPYRPTGLSTDARAAIRLVDELRWLNSIIFRATPRRPHTRPNPQVWAVKTAAAEVLDRSAELLDSPRRSRSDLSLAQAQLRDALSELELATTTRLPLVPDESGEADGGARAVVSSLDPSFRAQELSFVVGQIASNTDFAAAASQRSWIERLLGRQPEGIAGTLSAAQERAAAQVARNSLWLQNSLRGAVGLALAVLIAELSGVQHGFWVAFGTLSVLRSNALSTGQNIIRALAGTTAGFVVGGVLVYLIGTDTTLLWILLPFVILVAGLAPSAVSFAAGQASFTLTLLILFNLIAPAGWRIGLVRVEDVAIGGAVSLAVGLLFWPRGAGAALGRALARAYSDSAAYLATAISYGVGCCDPFGPKSAAPRREAGAAAASSRRLDVTFRSYLAERGAKPAPLAEITGLVTGVTGVRLAADAVLDLWDGNSAASGDRAVARTELVGAAERLTGWYEQFGASLIGGQAVPDPLPADDVADGRLVAAVGQDLRDPDGNATATGVRVIWTGDHLDAVRRLQATLVDPARAAVSDHALGRGNAARPRPRALGRARAAA